jgi:hypothetical protein
LSTTTSVPSAASAGAERVEVADLGEAVAALARLRASGRSYWISVAPPGSPRSFSRPLRVRKYVSRWRRIRSRHPARAPQPVNGRIRVDCPARRCDGVQTRAPTY